MPDALWAGILAGYAIAVPVGPIAILIFDTGIRRGFRTAAAAGAGAASADGFYATLAGLVGAAIAGVLTPVIDPARLVGAALLVLIALRGLVAGVRTAVGATDEGLAVGRIGPGRTYLMVLGLTIVNPMTFLYFGALMLGLPSVGGTEDKLVFAIGAFAASLSWQLLLAGAGWLLHGRLPPRLQAATRVIGSIMILAFAVRIAVAAG